jgi:hypothetical protein
MEPRLEEEQRLKGMSLVYECLGMVWKAKVYCMYYMGSY